MARPVPDRVPPLRVKRRRRDATLHRRVAVRTVVGRASAAHAPTAAAAAAASAAPTAPASVAVSASAAVRGGQHLLAGP